MELSRTRFAAAALVLAALGAIAGTSGAAATTSGGGPSGTVTTTTLPITFAKNATVTIAVSHLPANYNPWSPAGSDAVTAMVMQQVWPQVSILDDHLNTQVCTVTAANCPSALLVSAEPISLDPMTVVYQIAPDARWSDGVPITGADFSYLRQQVLSEASELPAIDPVVGYKDIKSIATSSDGKTVTVVFSKPYADWQSLFSNLVPSQIATAAGPNGFVHAFDGSDLANLVSGGPYRITHVIPGREVVLDRNPVYWGAKPGIARLIFRVETSEAATLDGLRKGTITIAQLPPGQAVNNLVASTTDLVSFTTYSPELWQLAFNTAGAVVDNLDVREAIAKAIDRHQLISDTIGLLTPSSSTVGNRLFGLGTTGGQANDASYSAVDIADAQSLLAAAGYTINANGIAVNSAGAPLVLTLDGPSGNGIINTVEAEIQAELLQAGIEVRIANEPIRTLLGDTLPSGQYTMAIVPYDVTPYLSTTAVLYTPSSTSSTSSTELGQGSVPGISVSSAKAGVAARADSDAGVSGAVSRDELGLNDGRLLPLFEQAATELNPSSADGLYNEIDIDLWGELPTLPLLQMPVTTVVNNALQGVTPAETWPTFLYNAQNWTWELNALPTVTTTTS